jgi:hypothetical protein
MLCTIWKDIVRVCIVLKTRIGRDAAITLYNGDVITDINQYRGN